MFTQENVDDAQVVMERTKNEAEDLKAQRDASIADDVQKQLKSSSKATTKLSEELSAALVAYIAARNCYENLRQALLPVAVPPQQSSLPNFSAKSRSLPSLPSFRNIDPQGKINSMSDPYEWVSAIVTKLEGEEVSVTRWYKAILSCFSFVDRDWVKGSIGGSSIWLDQAGADGQLLMNLSDWKT